MPFTLCCFSNKIYAPVIYKIVLKKLVDKKLVKRKYGLCSKNVALEMCGQQQKNHGFVDITSFILPNSSAGRTKQNKLMLLSTFYVYGKIKKGFITKQKAREQLSSLLGVKTPLSRILLFGGIFFMAKNNCFVLINFVMISFE